jgi:molybdopterin-synthase adenylyltransferase
MLSGFDRAHRARSVTGHPSLGPLSPQKDKEGRDRSVVVVGAGGLGVAALTELATHPIERIRIIDADCVELSNLHRQLLHGPADLGHAKADVAAEKLRRLAPSLEVDARVERLDGDNVADALAGYAVVIDATDNAATKFLLNDVCVLRRIPLVHAGVVGLVGQLMTIIPGETACLRCVFADAPSDDETASCQAAGILGPLAALVGALQAREAVKILTGVGQPATNRLLTIDSRSLRVRDVPLRRSPACPLCAKTPPDAVSSQFREENP